MTLQKQIKDLIKFKHAITTSKYITNKEGLMRIFFHNYANKGILDHRNSFISSQVIQKVHGKHLEKNHENQYKMRKKQSIIQTFQQPDKCRHTRAYKQLKNDVLYTYYSLLARFSNKSMLKKVVKDFKKDVPKQEINIKIDENSSPLKKRSEYEEYNKHPNHKSQQYNVVYNSIKDFLYSKSKKTPLPLIYFEYRKFLNTGHFLLNLKILIKELRQKLLLERHQFSHTDSFECPICNLTFSSKEILKRHIIISHTFDKTFIDNFRNIFRKNDENKENTDDSGNKDNSEDKENTEEYISENKESVESTDKKNNGNDGEDTK